MAANGGKTFWSAEIDISTSPGRFSIKYFNGLFAAELLGQDYYLYTDHWYRISMTIEPPTSGFTTFMNITAKLDGETDPSVSIVLGPYPVSVGDWASDSGLAGLTSNQSSSLFSVWKVEQAT